MNTTRLPEGQALWASALVRRVAELLQGLANEERAVYTALWKLMAQHGSPITSHHFADLKYSPDRIRDLLATINKTHLLWFDDDLRAVLRCPPFSVLHTPHPVKVFGWERAYAASLIEAPLTLLVYGPNVWLNIQTTCPRSGETLKYRVMLRDDGSLRLDAPSEAEQWVVWLPLPDNPLDDDVFDWLQEARLRIGAFHTLEDLDIHRYYEGGPSGVIYTLEEAVYLSEGLLWAYGRALELK